MEKKISKNTKNNINISKSIDFENERFNQEYSKKDFQEKQLNKNSKQGYNNEKIENIYNKDPSFEDENGVSKGEEKDDRSSLLDYFFLLYNEMQNQENRMNNTHLAQIHLLEEMKRKSNENDDNEKYFFENSNKDFEINNEIITELERKYQKNLEELAQLRMSNDEAMFIDYEQEAKNLEQKAKEIQEDEKQIEDTLRQIAEIENEYEESKEKNRISREIMKQQEEILRQREKEIFLRHTRLDLAKDIKFYRAEMEKFIHNKTQELKGNIRVFCRVRPLLDIELKELQNSENSFISNYEYILYPKDDTIVFNLLQNKPQINKNTNQPIFGQETYIFDKIFKPEDTQEIIFDEISQLVQSALDGYKVCIFAYGQTGSGKTYTMQGERNQKRGVIPRSLEQIFSTIGYLNELGWVFNIKVSCMEIYCDQIRDLLNNNQKNVVKDIRPENFLSIEIKKIEDFYELMAIAIEKRVVAETQCNEKSSRSHCIYQIRITAKNQENKQERNGALNFIDLAGSEKIHNSNVEGQRYI